MARPSIAMGEDFLCDLDPILTDTPFFKYPGLDRVQGRDLVIAGTKVGTCHLVLVCIPFLVSSGAVHCFVLAAKLLFQNGV